MLLIALLLSQSVYGRYVIEREMAEKRDARATELEVITGRAEALQAKVEHLKNERGIEEEIRGRFDVAKEGERVVILLEDKEATGTPGMPEREINTAEGETKGLFETLMFWR